jgi:hypothetical protein
MTPPTGTAVDAAEVAAAVGAVPGVVRLSGGVSGEVATYLPGTRIPGVRVRSQSVAVHVVARLDGPHLPQLAADVRAAVRHRFPGVEQVDVHIDDLADDALDEDGPSGEIESVADPEEHVVRRDEPVRARSVPPPGDPLMLTDSGSQRPAVIDLDDEPERMPSSRQEGP